MHHKQETSKDRRDGVDEEYLGDCDWIAALVPFFIDRHIGSIRFPGPRGIRIMLDDDIDN